MSNYLEEIKIFNKKKLQKSQIQFTSIKGQTEFQQIDFDKGIVEINGIESSDNTFKKYGFIPLTKLDLQIGNINKYLAFGSQDGACDWNEIQSNNISFIVNLCSDFISNQFENRGIVYLNLSIKDDENENLENNLCKIIEFVALMREQNDSNRCLIHCNAGMSRSAAFAIAILIKYEKMSFEKAYIAVASTSRGHISPNSNFINQLKKIK